MSIAISISKFLVCLYSSLYLSRSLNIKKGSLVIEVEVEVPFVHLRFHTTHFVLSWIVLQNPTLLESCHRETRIDSFLKMASCCLGNVATIAKCSVPHSTFQLSILPNIGFVTFFRVVLHAPIPRVYSRLNS